MEQHFHGARLGCAGTALSEQHRSQSAVVKSTALLHAHTLLEHRPVLRLSFPLGGVERIWQLVPVCQPCSPSHGITANIQSSRILCQFLWACPGSSLWAFGTQQLDVSWQGGSPGGDFQPSRITTLQSMS